MQPSLATVIINKQYKNKIYDCQWGNSESNGNRHIIEAGTAFKNEEKPYRSLSYNLAECP